MTNLINNGIDHGKFYIEWAKRGGVVKTSVSEQPAMAKCLGVKQDGRALFVFFIDECENERWHYGFVYPKDQDSLRMATPDECAEAGVDYIEPPMLWRLIDTLTTDIPTTLFVCDEKSKQIGTLTGQNIFGGACISGWDDHDTKPTHWMPKPQPPKDE